MSDVTQRPRPRGEQAPHEHPRTPRYVSEGSVSNRPPTRDPIGDRHTAGVRRRPMRRGGLSRYSLTERASTTPNSHGGQGALRARLSGPSLRGPTPPTPLRSPMRRLRERLRHIQAPYTGPHTATTSPMCSGGSPHATREAPSGPDDVLEGRFAEGSATTGDVPPPSETETRNLGREISGHPPRSPPDQNTKSPGVSGVSRAEGSASPPRSRLTRTDGGTPEGSDRARLASHPALIGPDDTATTTVHVPFPRADELLAEGSDGHTYLGAGVVLRDTLHHWGYSLERILDFERRSEDHEWAVEVEVSADV